MKKTNTKKALSLFLALVMILSCWVWVAPKVGALPATDTTYAKGDKYGTLPWSGTGDRWFKWATGDDYVYVYYPSHMYLDVSETLQSAGYHFDVKWHFGNNQKYRILLGAPVWGDHSAFQGHPTKYYTMNNIFSDYSVDAALPNGYYTSAGLYDGDSDYDLRVVGYGYSGQGSDGFSANNARHDKYVLFRSNANAGYEFSSSIYLKGTPKSDYKGKTTEYNTSGDSIGSYGLAQQYGINNTTWSTHSSSSMFNQKGSDSSYYEGQWIEMQWFVTVYDKSALNAEITKAAEIANNQYNYSKYVVDGNYNTFLSENSQAQRQIAVRAQTQTDIDTAKNELYAQSNALYYAASNTALREAVAQAQAIKNETDYTSNYTEATRTAFETALYNAERSSYYTNPPRYHAYTNNNAGRNAAADQTSVDNLTSALTSAISSLKRQYLVTFTNSKNTTISSKYYEDGAALTAPANSTKASDATYHYTYAWSPEVATTVTTAVNYKEIETAAEHSWSDWVTTVYPNCTTEGSKYRTCTVCSYREDATISKSEHTPLPAVKENIKDATCKDTGSYESVIYCDECSDVIERTTVEIPKTTNHSWSTDISSNGADNHGYKCSVCGEYDSTRLEAHSWELESTDTYPTCTQDGHGTYKCSACPQTKEGVIPAKGHTETDVAAVEATCQQVGYTAGKYCSACNTYTEGHVSTGYADHKLTKTDATAATCISKGNKAYWTCSVCDKLFSDDEGKNETTLGACETPATGTHVYDENGWKQHNNGNKHRVYCTNDPDCKVFKEESHVFTGGVKSTDDGYHYFACAKCSTAYGTPSGGFDQKEKCYDSETAYDKVDENSHNAYCICGQTVSEGHTWGEWTSNSDASAEGGSMTATCADCGETKQTSCTFEVTKTEAASCTENGYKTWECSDASCNNGYTEILEAINHANKVHHDAVAATCIKGGKIEYWSCPDCGKNFSDEACTTEATDLSTAIDPDNHNLQNHDAKAPTCTEGGWDAYVTCKRCSYTTKTERGPLDHAWSEDFILKNNGEYGTHYQVCTRDGCKAETTPVPHTWNDGEITTPATCIEKGEKTFTCTAKDCGATYKAAVDKDSDNHTGRTYTKDINIVEGTCKDVKTWDEVTYCEGCNAELSTAAKTGEKNSKNHVGDTYTKDEDYVAGTCNSTETWNEVTYCESCDAKLGSEAKTGEKDMNNHVGGTRVEKKNTVAGTCNSVETWDDVTYCEGCDAELGSEAKSGEKDANNHVGETRVEKEDAVAGTCAEAETWNDVTYCEDCDAKLGTVARTGEKDKDNHVGGTYTKDEDRVAGTCNSTEAWNEVTYCESCDAELGSEAKTGEKDANNHVGETYMLEKNVVAGTCSSRKTWDEVTYCSDCDAELETVAKTGARDANNHVNTETKDAVAPECEADGYEAGVYCNDCEKWISGHGRVPATDHDYDLTKSEENLTRPVQYIDGTWAQGYYTYKCKNNAEHFVTEKIDRADYTKFDAAVEDLEKLLDDATVPEETKNKIISAIAETPDNLIVTEQAIVDAAANALIKLKEEITNVLGGCVNGQHKYPTDENGNIICTEIVEATCTKSGYYIYKCDYCGKEGKQTIPATGHSWVVNNDTDAEGWIVITEATCFVTGTKYRVCEKGCGTSGNLDENSREYDFIPSYDQHVWVAVSGKEATCTQSGYTEHIRCEICNFVDGKKVIPTLDHVDEDADGECDDCYGRIPSPQERCSCVCHKHHPLMKLIYKILQFFWKLLGIGRSCACGDVHY